MGGRKERVMANEPLQAGDLVEILSTAERPDGRPAAPRRYGYVVEAADEDSRVAVQVPDRQYPLHLPLGQLHRVGDRSPSATDSPSVVADGVGQTPLTVRGAQYGLGSTHYSGR